MRRLSALSLLFIFTGAGSCSKSLDDLCRSDFANLNQKVENARIALRPWNELDDPSDREVAMIVIRSVPRKKPVIEMAEKDRQDWKDWAENQLVIVHDFIEIAQSHPKAQGAIPYLNRIANELVTFYGYAVIGDGTKMTRSLAAIEEESRKVIEESCSKR